MPSCTASVAWAAQYHKGSKAGDRYCWQGKGLGTAGGPGCNTPRSGSSGAQSWWEHGALGCWQIGLQWLLLACLLPALGKDTSMNLNNKSPPTQPGSHSTQGTGVEHHLWQDCTQGLCLAWWVTASHSESPESNGTWILKMSQMPHCNF